MSNIERRPIPGFERYSVSRDGTIYGQDGTPQNPAPNKLGYIPSCLRKDSKSCVFLAHRIVALTYIPNPYNKPYVNHKNGVKSDNRVENLEWVTPSENAFHARRMGLGVNKRGTEHRRAKWNAEDVLQMWQMHRRGDAYAAIARYFGERTSNNIQRILRRERYVQHQL